MADGVQPVAPDKWRTAFENREHVLAPEQCHPLAAVLIAKPLQDYPQVALGVRGKLVLERRAIREHPDQSGNGSRSVAGCADVGRWGARCKRGLIRGHERLTARWSRQFQANTTRLAEIVVWLPIRDESLNEAKPNLCHGAALCPIRCLSCQLRK